MAAVVILLLVAAGAGAWWWHSQQGGGAGSVPRSEGSATPVVDPNAGSKRNWLVGTGGPVVGKHFHVGERTVTLGRMPQNFIQIADKEASRRHLNLRPGPDGLLLTDMTSKFGTFVNGQQTKSATLKDGDEIRIGQCKLVYRREAQFSHDDTRNAKSIDAAMSAETGAGLDMGGLVVRTLQECNGDWAETARRLKLPEDVLKNLVKQHQPHA